MNDLIRLAIDMACEDFGGDPEDSLFNAANFSGAITKLANINGVIDGRVVRILLCGRPDVIPMKDGSHYRRIGD